MKVRERRARVTHQIAQLVAARQRPLGLLPERHEICEGGSAILEEKEELLPNAPLAVEGENVRTVRRDPPPLRRTGEAAPRVELALRGGSGGFRASF